MDEERVDTDTRWALVGGKRRMEIVLWHTTPVYMPWEDYDIHT
jgi:hypothetical protein